MDYLSGGINADSCGSIGEATEKVKINFLNAFDFSCNGSTRCAPDARNPFVSGFKKCNGYTHAKAKVRLHSIVRKYEEAHQPPGA